MIGVCVGRWVFPVGLLNYRYFQSQIHPQFTHKSANSWKCLNVVEVTKGQICLVSIEHSTMMMLWPTHVALQELLMLTILQRYPLQSYSSVLPPSPAVND